MQPEEKFFIGEIIKTMKKVLEKEKKLNEIFGSQTEFFSEVLSDLQVALFQRLSLVYNFDGSDDGNYKEGLFSLVIEEKMTIWELLQYKKEQNNVHDKYTKREINLDEFYEEKYQINSKYGIY